MNKCATRHEELSFKGDKCPLCNIIAKFNKDVVELHAVSVKLSRANLTIKELEDSLKEEREIAQHYKDCWKTSSDECNRLYSGKSEGER